MQVQVQENVSLNSVEMPLKSFVNLIGPVFPVVDPKSKRKPYDRIEIRALINESGMTVLQAVASDGPRLVLRTIVRENIPKGSILFEPFMLDYNTAKNILALAKKTKHGNLKLELNKDDKLLNIEIEGVAKFQTPLVADHFPPLKPLFEAPNTKREPYNGICKIWIDQGLMASLLKACPTPEVGIFLPKEKTYPIFLRSYEDPGYRWQALIMPIEEPAEA